MSETPSHRRRKGREAYDHTSDPWILCPYIDQDKRDDWFDGWKEADKLAHSHTASRRECLECDRGFNADEDYTHCPYCGNRLS